MENETKFIRKFTTRLIISILLLPVLALYLVILHYISRAVVDEGGIFHWFPIVLSAVAFIAAGVFAGMQDYDSAHWKPVGKNGAMHFLYPLGHTEAEVDEAVNKHAKKDDYATSDITIVIAFLVIDAIVLGLSLYFSTYLLNAVVVFPLWVITALIVRIPSGSAYITAVLGYDYKEYVCENCGCINGKFDYTTSNKKESSWIQSTPVKVTDEYTNGIDTLEVERTETRYDLKHNTSFDMNYVCRRCKKKRVEKFSYTKTL